MDADDVRLSPIMTYADVAAVLDVPYAKPAAVRNWSHRPGMVTTRPNRRRGWPTVPVVGLMQAHTIASLLKIGATPRRIGQFARLLEERHGEFALANPRYVSDGYDLYERHGEDELSNIVSRQGAFPSVLEPYLLEIKLWPDQQPGAFQPARLNGLAEIDPRFNAGRISFVRTRMPLFAIVGSLDAGEHPAAVRDDYGVNDAEWRVITENRDWLRQAA